MSDKEIEVGVKLAVALKKLPKDKADYFLGYAEGVEAAVNSLKKKEVEEGNAQDDRNDVTGEGR